MERVKSQWVVNYGLDADIQIISGNLDLSTLKMYLPGSYERYLGATYFNRKSSKLAEQGEDVLSIWFFRAALAHFQGILDLVLSDIPQESKQIWKRSEIKENLYSHDLVYTMTRVRNIALHTGKLKCSMQDREITFLPGGTRDVIHIVLDVISPDHFETKDQVTTEVIDWFNRQASIWSANSLLTESCFILMVALDNFIRMNLQHLDKQNDAHEKIIHAERALSINL